MQRITLDDPRWLAYVSRHPEAGPFHHPSWSTLLTRCYGFPSFALVEFEANGAVARGIPLMEVGGRLQRRGWVSLPYSDYVAPLGGSSAEDAAFHATLASAWREAGVEYLQIRAPVPGQEVHQHETDVIHVLDLDGDADAVMGRFHKMAVRGIRRAEREGVTVRAGERAQDLTETFYDLHLATRRRQGSPIQPRRFFRLLWDECISSGLGSVLLAYRGAEAVAGSVFLSWNGTLVYKFSASRAAARSLRANHLVIWRAIEAGCRDGMRLLDLGRSAADNAGLREFKTHWGAAERPLLYTTLSGETAVRPAGHSPRLMQAMIRRSPAIVCRAAGELLYRFAA